MKAKRKLLISMMAIVFVLLAVVATVAIAFALQQQTITTTLNINYEVKDLDGTVSATYTVDGETYNNLIAKKNGVEQGNILVFRAADTEAAGSLDFPQEVLDNGLQLNSTNSSVVIKYLYSNEGDKHYIASLNFGLIEHSNMEIQFSTNGTDYIDNRYAVVVPSGAKNVEYYIRISIKNKAQGAKFAGEFNWDLAGTDKSTVGYETLPSVNFVANGEEYSVSYVNESSLTNGELTYPSSINGYPVTSIVESSIATEEQKAAVTSVVIPETVTTIGDNAFEGFTNLETVTFTESAAGASVASVDNNLTIGNKAFYGCTSLQELVLPEGTTTIGDNAFVACESISRVVVPESLTYVGEIAFDGCVNMQGVYVSNVTKYSQITFLSGRSNPLSQGHVLYVKNASGEYEIPKKIELESGITSLGKSAFYYCTSIEEVVIPDTVTEFLEKSTFESCSNLKTVTLSNNLQVLPTNTFSRCESLTTINMPTALTTIGQSAFYGCASLKNATLPEGLTTIGKTAFRNSGLTSVTIPSTVITISDMAFYQCYDIETIVFNDCEVAIGNQAFRDCTAVTSVDFGDYIKSIGEYAFAGLDALTEVSIFRTSEGGESWTIAKNAFSQCDVLTDVSIVAQNTTLTTSTSIFTDSLAVKTVVLRGDEGEIILGNSSFNRCPIEELTLDNVSFTATSFAAKTTLKKVSISGEYDILEASFRNCANLETVDLTGYTGHIGKHAFADCGIKNIIGLNCPTIGQYAFYNCNVLESVTIGADVHTIEGSAFRFCDKLKNVTINSNSITIGVYAFYQEEGANSLTNVVLNPNLTWVLTYSTKTKTLTAEEIASPSTIGTYLSSTYKAYTISAE